MHAILRPNVCGLSILNLSNQSLDRVNSTKDI